MQTSTEQLNMIRNFLKETNGNPEKPVAEIRHDMAEAARQLPALSGIQVKPVRINQLSGEWVAVPGMNPEEGGKAILYIHGGGFISGTCEIYRDLAARISAASGVPVLTFEYRLAPEHRYPAANEDCLSAYRWLIAEGYPPDGIIFGGDSVGASLALMSLISIRDEGGALPAGAFLLSPHCDLVHLDGESYESRANADPTGSREGSRKY